MSFQVFSLLRNCLLMFFSCQSLRAQFLNACCLVLDACCLMPDACLLLAACCLMLEHLPDPSTKDSTKGGGRRPPPSVDGYEAIRLFGYEAIRLSVAHGPWSVNLVDFQQHLLFSLGPHITVPTLAFHSDGAHYLQPLSNAAKQK